jgi:hypothetical protein
VVHGEEGYVKAAGSSKVDGEIGAGGVCREESRQGETLVLYMYVIGSPVMRGGSDGAVKRRNGVGVE